MKETPLFPLFLKLRGITAVVAGGGPVAARKVNALLRAGAGVTVVAPEAVPKILHLAKREKITLLRRRWRRADIRRGRLVLAATSDRALNLEIARAATADSRWVNVASSPEASSFFLPSMFSRGEIVLAISTGGRSPLLARTLRRRLGDVLSQEYAAWARLLGRIRGEAQRRIRSERKRAAGLRRLVRSERRLLPLLRGGRFAEARRIGEKIVFGDTGLRR